MKDKRLWNKDGHSFQTDIISHKIVDNFWCIWPTQKLFLGTVFFFLLKKGPLEPSSCFHNPHLLNRNDYIMVNVCLWRCRSISRTEPIRIFSWGLRIKRFGSRPDGYHTKVVGSMAEKAIFNCTHSRKVIVKKKTQWCSYIRKWIGSNSQRDEDSSFQFFTASSQLLCLVNQYEFYELFPGFTRKPLFL